MICKNLKECRVSLSNDSFGFLHFVHPFSSGVFTANGSGTAFMYDSRYFYIFDPHSRDNEGFVSPNGTSVLLKFKTSADAENYYKHVLLTQANKTNVGYEYQLYSIETSDKLLTKIKEYLRKEKDKCRMRKRNANSANTNEGNCASEEYRDSRISGFTGIRRERSM